MKAPEGLCAATILIAKCNAMFHLGHLYPAAVQEDQIFKDMPPDSLLYVIREGLADNYTTKKAGPALGPPSGFLAENHSILATLLCQYQSHWQRHNILLYYQMQLYVPAAGGGRTEVLQRYDDDPIARLFGAKHILELVSRKYYWLGLLRKVKAYTQACSTSQRVCLVRHRLH
jgi:hypothetical protein